MGDFNWDISQVTAATREIVKQLDKIKSQSESLMEKNKKYRAALKDQVSEDANKSIIRLKRDAQRMQDDVETRNKIIIEANKQLREIEDEDRIMI